MGRTIFSPRTSISARSCIAPPLILFTGAALERSLIDSVLCWKILHVEARLSPSKNLFDINVMRSKVENRMASGLEKYRAKRRFDSSPEPEGAGAHGSSPIFVIQKHHARRMHYDLRLEIGGTLRSWAVPEGPCLDPKIRRFAKLVEDHPLDYAGFEGRIPDGNYGAGTVIVWDRGTWVTLSDPDTALAKGELKFRLVGEKLKGGWTLVRLPDEETNWLLIKERDIAARPLSVYDILKEEPNSVISGRPVDEPPIARKKAPSIKAESLPGARAAELPQRWSPELAIEH